MMIKTLLCILFCVGTATVTTVTTTFRVALPQMNINKLRDIVYDISDYRSPNYGKYLSPSQILAVICPKPQYWMDDHVMYYFYKNNITCTSYCDALRCVGDTNTVYKLFRMDNAQDHYTIPIRIRGLVHFIEGLYHNNKNEVSPLKGLYSDPSVDPGYVGREVLLKLYNISKNLIANETLGVIEYQGGSGFDVDGLKSSQSNNGQRNNKVAPDHILGNDTQADTETDLDLQMESQLAPEAQLWYDGSSNWLWTWAVDYFNTKDIAYVVSHSWGWATDKQCDIEHCTSGSSADYIARVNNEYLKLSARGVTMTVASGDSGAPGRSDASCDAGNRTVVPIFPGSSPWVISVGATYVVANSTPTNVSYSTPLCKKDGCATGLTEATINTAAVGWTAGGGFGEFATEGVLPWQAVAVQAYLNKSLPLPTYFNPNGRGYPDVAAIGHNCPVWEYGSLSGVDGTSCSSPTFAAVIAILNAHQLTRGRPRLGLATPLLYSMYYDDPTIYQDITTGNNWCTEGGCCPTRPDGGSEYGYQATVGWDPVAGLGTPNVGKMLAWLDLNT